MKDIVIVCAGTYGLELLSVIEAINYTSRKHGTDTYNILGFIDDNTNALDGKGIKYPIIGRISDWKPRGNEVYAIGAAFGDVKRKIVASLKERGCKFETVIAPWSMVSPYCEMGEGCYITAYSISAGVKLGNFVNVNASLLTPGTVIGDFSTTTGFTVVDNATIGERVFVGSHAVIQPGVKVGDDVKVTAGSIVTADIPNGVTVFGVPATVIA